MAHAKNESSASQSKSPEKETAASRQSAAEGRNNRLPAIYYATQALFFLALFGSFLLSASGGAYYFFAPSADQPIEFRDFVPKGSLVPKPGDLLKLRSAGVPDPLLEVLNHDVYAEVPHSELELSKERFREIVAEALGQVPASSIAGWLVSVDQFTDTYAPATASNQAGHIVLSRDTLHAVARDIRQRTQALCRHLDLPAIHCRPNEETTLFSAPWRSPETLYFAHFVHLVDRTFATQVQASAELSRTVESVSKKVLANVVVALASQPPRFGEWLGFARKLFLSCMIAGFGTVMIGLPLFLLRRPAFFGLRAVLLVIPLLLGLLVSSVSGYVYLWTEANHSDDLTELRRTRFGEIEEFVERVKSLAAREASEYRRKVLVLADAIKTNVASVSTEPTIGQRIDWLRNFLKGYIAIVGQLEGPVSGPAQHDLFSIYRNELVFPTWVPRSHPLVSEIEGLDRELGGQHGRPPGYGPEAKAAAIGIGIELGRLSQEFCQVLYRNLSTYLDRVPEIRDLSPEGMTYARLTSYLETVQATPRPTESACELTIQGLPDKVRRSDYLDVLTQGFDGEVSQLAKALAVSVGSILNQSEILGGEWTRLDSEAGELARKLAQAGRAEDVLSHPVTRKQFPIAPPSATNITDYLSQRIDAIKIAAKDDFDLAVKMMEEDYRALSDLPGLQAIKDLRSLARAEAQRLHAVVRNRLFAIWPLVAAYHIPERKHKLLADVMQLAQGSINDNECRAGAAEFMQILRAIARATFFTRDGLIREIENRIGCVIPPVLRAALIGTVVERSFGSPSVDQESLATLRYAEPQLHKVVTDSIENTSDWSGLGLSVFRAALAQELDRELSQQELLFLEGSIEERPFHMDDVFPLIWASLLDVFSVFTGILMAMAIRERVGRKADVEHEFVKQEEKALKKLKKQIGEQAHRKVWQSVLHLSAMPPKWASSQDAQLAKEHNKEMVKILNGNKQVRQLLKRELQALSKYEIDMRAVQKEYDKNMDWLRMRSDDAEIRRKKIQARILHQRIEALGDEDAELEVYASQVRRELFDVSSALLEDLENLPATSLGKASAVADSKSDRKKIELVIQYAGMLKNLLEKLPGGVKQ